jgi:hypothetical protein
MKIDENKSGIMDCNCKRSPKEVGDVDGIPIV